MTGTRVGSRSSMCGLAFVAWLAAVVLAPGCGWGTTAIGDIQARPAEFAGKEVTVAGEARNVVKLPFLPGFYSIADKTGEILVLADGDLPASGSAVRIRARVESAATVGGRSFGLHLRQVAAK